MVKESAGSVKSIIDGIEKTDENLTSRAGLVPVSRYIRKTGIADILAGQFAFLKKNNKGLRLVSFFHQVLCFFFDGTKFSLSRFDQIKEDAGYAASIETEQREMASSHAVKRLGYAFTNVRVWLFRRILRRLFLWRLTIENPSVIKLGLDTMVLDNDDADKREGVEPTYKKVKGFQPLQMYWGRYLVDAIFRNGKAHSNHGNHAQRMIGEAVRFIRRFYRKDVPIILLADAGFYDETLFRYCDALGIGFIIGGKLYEDIKEYIGGLPDEVCYEYTKKKQTWYYCEFGSSRKSWQGFWRAVFAKPIHDDDGQVLLDFARPETLIYTNLGMSNAITEQVLFVRDASKSEISAEAIITAYHERGRDELVNRGLKDFGTEHLPFEKFSSNAAWYYLMAISFVLFESYKYDLGSDVVPLTWYASTFRRRFLDIAGKMVCKSGRLILKIARVAFESLKLDVVWERSWSAVPIG